MLTRDRLNCDIPMAVYAESMSFTRECARGEGKQGRERARDRKKERSSNANLLLWDEITDTDNRSDCSVQQPGEKVVCSYAHKNTRLQVAISRSALIF